MSNLNPVEITVLVAGQEVHFVKVELLQKFNSHHYCSVLVNYEELSTEWLSNPIEIINYIGESITITMRHKETGETNVFNGIIKDISHQGRHGGYNHFLIEGVSETWRLDGKPTMDSFENKTLEQIVMEAVANSGNGAEVEINPKFKNPIEYISQYTESAFDFLNRLSWLYGESFYNDGTTTYFGSPEPSDSTAITYEKDLVEYNLKASLQPPNFQRYNYLVNDDVEWFKPTRSEVPEATGYLSAALDKSEQFYTSDAVLPLDATVGTSDDILKMVDIERTRSVANMLVLSGCSVTCKVKIGGIVMVDFPEYIKTDTTAGNFIITEVTHIMDEEGHYSNTFSGVRASLEYVPVANVKLPQPSAERATVYSNADPDGMGRVKIQFQWQKKTNKTTNWIRLQAPDAGGASGSGRGYIFVPEEKDEVLVNFLNSDPSRPYVSGSLFPKSFARGGLVDNNLKSIITRSGHTIEFNDGKDFWGITVRDDAGNVIKLDSTNKNIEITAPETIKVKAKNLEIDIEEDITTKVGRDINTEVGQDSVTAVKRDIKKDSGRDILMASNSKTEISALTEIDLYGKQQFIGYSDGNVEMGAFNRTHVYGGISLITAKDKIDYLAPQMNQLPQSGIFEYDKEPKVVAVKWKDKETMEEVDRIYTGMPVILEAQTRNHEEGDTVEIKGVHPEGMDVTNGNKELTFSGTVESDGFVRIEVQFEDDEIPQENLSKV